MSRFVFIFYIFSVSCFSQQIRIIEETETAHFAVQKDFEYLFVDQASQGIIPIATIQASGKWNIADLFFAIQNEANQRGANAFKVVEYINDDEITNKQSLLTLVVFFVGKSVLTENNSLKEKNVVYIFGNDKVGEGKTSFKLNGKKEKVKNRHYYKFENKPFNELKISKGGIFGAETSIIGDDNKLPVFLTLSGLGIAPKVVYKGYKYTGSAYATGGFGISINTGSIEFMNPNLAYLLIAVWEEEYSE